MYNFSKKYAPGYFLDVYSSLTGPKIQCRSGPDHRLQDTEHSLYANKEPQGRGKLKYLAVFLL